MVTRTNDNKEVYFDQTQKILWGDRLQGEYNLETSAGICNSNISENGYIEGATWRLPTLNEYDNAWDKGINPALPNINHFFLTSTTWVHTFPNGVKNTIVMHFRAQKRYGHGTDGYDTGTHSFHSVRCVAKVNLDVK